MPEAAWRCEQGDRAGINSCRALTYGSNPLHESIFLDYIDLDEIRIRTGMRLATSDFDDATLIEDDISFALEEAYGAGIDM